MGWRRCGVRRAKLGVHWLRCAWGARAGAIRTRFRSPYWLWRMRGCERAGRPAYVGAA